MAQEDQAASEQENRTTYTQAERDAMAKEGLAMPDGSFPIKDREDVSHAITTAGLGNDASSAIKEHIIKRADALGCSDLIPDGWVGKAPAKRSSKRSSSGRKERRSSVPQLPEVRLFRGQEGLEIREEGREGNLVTIRGAVVVYDQPYLVRDVFGEFEERMHPGVARDVMGDDTRYLYNHAGMVLARTTSGTLSIEDSPTALWTNATLDVRNSHANDLVIAVERGDVSQMSVGFVCGQDEWNDDFDQRDIYRFASMPDTSAVSFPAAPMTSLEIAHRMALEMPVESRARFRKLAVDERAGKTLSQANASKITAAHEALTSVLAAAGLGVDEPEESDGASTADTSANAEPSEQVDGSTSIVDPGESVDVRSDEQTPDEPIVVEDESEARDEAIVEEVSDDPVVTEDEDEDPAPTTKTSRALWLRAEARKRRVLP
jgi:HK97 family phage prohead protease